MSLDIGGVTFTGNSSVLTINNAVTGLNCLVGGAIQRPNQPAFKAVGPSSNNHVVLANNTWKVMNFGSTAFNIGSGFNTGTGRFTAPVDGTYWFAADTYIEQTGGNVNDYNFPVFAVNGAQGTRTGNQNTGGYCPRIRGYGSTTQLEYGHITQTYQLAASDYVEYWIFSINTTASPNQYYEAYNYFMGVLIG